MKIKTSILILLSLVLTLWGIAFSDNTSVDDYCNLGIENYRAAKFDAALVEFQRALALDPKNATAKKYIDLIFKYGLSAASPQISESLAQPPVVSKEDPALTQRIEESLQFVENNNTDNLCQSGIDYYRQGKYNQALQEFKKALALDPQNAIAKNYIDMIFKEDMPVASTEKPAPVVSAQPSTTEEEVAANLKKGQAYLGESNIDEGIMVGEKHKEGLLDVSGEIRLGMGITPDHFYWKDANADKIGIPREKNWRYLWGDKRHNTFDPEIYDRFKVNLLTTFDSPLNVFTEINIDPWTFIGKNHVTITSASGADSVDMDLKYWSNATRTINEIYRSNMGNIINLSQIKVIHGRTTPSTPKGITDWGTQFNQIDPMAINRTYRPVRKLWLNYVQDDYNLKIFPLSDQFEALTSNDPLKLSNTHMYWEESPWLDEYEPSRIFERANNPIKKGKWIRRTSFYAKDSSEDFPHRLTFLRGVSFNADTDSYSLRSTVATPLSFWDEYERSNSIEQATQLRLPVNDALNLGFLATTKIGVNGGSMEALNQLESVDVSYKPENDTFYAQIAESHTSIQEAAGFNTTYDGVGAKLGWSYDQSRDKNQGIYKSGAYLAHMDGKFYPGLSNYRYTRRDDPYFSRNICFAEINPDDQPGIWGNGIDRGRNVLGFNISSRHWQEQLNNDLAYRNVHRDSGKYIESVLRNESTYKVNPRLTTKLLLYYQNAHQTHAKEDPLIYAKTTYSLTDYFAEDDAHVENSEVLDGKDPSVGYLDVGAKYQLIEDMLSVEGIYERTNDPLDFPRTLLDDTYVTTIQEDGRYWDKVVPFIYDQKFFSQPPYNYYNIAKMKFIYTPAKEWEHILSYTYNQNQHASGLDDNINHVGIETAYSPTSKWTFWFKYMYAATIDIYKQNLYQTSDFFEWHHNFFFAADYKINKNESFSFLYGEFVNYSDPYEQASWTLSALDTQHLIRIFYRRTF